MARKDSLTTGKIGAYTLLTRPLNQITAGGGGKSDSPKGRYPPWRGNAKSTSLSPDVLTLKIMVEVWQRQAILSGTGRLHFRGQVSGLVRTWIG